MTTSDSWYDPLRRMTPDKVAAFNFPLARRGRHGYEQEPVGRFVAAVHGEIVRLINERAALYQEVQRLRARILGGQRSEDGSYGVLFGKDDAHAHAVRILSSAQLTADQYVADAQAYSSRLTREARDRRDEIMAQTRQHAAMLLEEARTRARQAAVEAMDQEILPPQSELERRAAEGEVAYLRTFSEVYRQHLKIYTESIQRMLDDWEAKERAMPPQRQISGLDSPVSGRYLQSDRTRDHPSL